MTPLTTDEVQCDASMSQSRASSVGRGMGSNWARDPRAVAHVSTARQPAQSLARVLALEAEGLTCWLKALARAEREWPELAPRVVMTASQLPPLRSRRVCGEVSLSNRVGSSPREDVRPWRTRTSATVGKRAFVQAMRAASLGGSARTTAALMKEGRVVVVMAPA